MEQSTFRGPEIVAQFGLQASSITPIDSGLINQTYTVQTSNEGKWILQAVNSIFPPEVNLDINALTQHLNALGLTTPTLRRTNTGELWTESDGKIWRLMTHIEGVSVERIDTQNRAEQAGRMLGRFHKAVVDFDWTFKSQRAGVHDTPRHIKVLQSSLEDEQYRSHRLYEEVRPVASSILEILEDLPPLPQGGVRTVHGDPKISNIRFEAQTGHAICMLDLDTVARMQSLLEMGDAFRSWCNPAQDGEDDPQPEFSLAFFEASANGYAQAAGDLLSAEERQHIPQATILIASELAVRFATDALQERYFGWDQTRYPTRGEHNLVRAKGQAHLAKSLQAQLDSATRVVTKAFAHVIS